MYLDVIFPETFWPLWNVFCRNMCKYCCLCFLLSSMLLVFIDIPSWSWRCSNKRRLTKQNIPYLPELGCRQHPSLFAFSLAHLLQTVVRVLSLVIITQWLTGLFRKCICSSFLVSVPTSRWPETPVVKFFCQSSFRKGLSEVTLRPVLNIFLENSLSETGLVSKQPQDMPRGHE